MEDYLEFTNHTWGASDTLDKFVPCSRNGDSFILLIAGHSRLAGEKARAEKNGIDIRNLRIDAQFHDVDSISQIVEIQRRENIHAGVSKDREARVLAEDFLWQKKENPKLTQKQFVENSGVSPEFLSDVIAYVKLPGGIRELTDNGGLPFTIGIELARALTPITHELKQNNPGVDEEQLERLIKDDLMRFITFFNNKKRNVTNTRAKIRQKAKGLREKHEAQRLKAKKIAAPLVLEFFDAREFTVQREALTGTVTENLKETKIRMDDESRKLHASSVELMEMQELELDEELAQEAREIGRVALTMIK
jgi:hypothetical protein